MDLLYDCEPSFKALEVTAAFQPSHIVTVSQGNYLGGCLECLKLNNNAVDIFISRLSDKIVESLFRDWHSRCLKAFSCRKTLRAEVLVRWKNTPDP